MKHLFEILLKVEGASPPFTLKIPCPYRMAFRASAAGFGGWFLARKGFGGMLKTVCGRVREKCF